MIRTSLKRNKRIIIIYSVVMIIGIITGIFYSKKTQINIYQYLFDSINNKKIININYYHILFIVFTIIGSFIYIGPLLSFFNMFLEGFSIGLLFYALVAKKRLRGFAFGLVITLFGKFIYLLIIVILGIISIRFILHQRDKSNTYYYFKYSLIITFSCVINEIVLLNLFNKLCVYFSFLIK